MGQDSIPKCISEYQTVVSQFYISCPSTLIPEIVYYNMAWHNFFVKTQWKLSAGRVEEANWLNDWLDYEKLRIRNRQNLCLLKFYTKNYCLTIFHLTSCHISNDIEVLWMRAPFGKKSILINFDENSSYPIFESQDKNAALDTFKSPWIYQDVVCTF